MSSWRDNASQQAQEDLDAIVDTAISIAQEQLGAHAKFFPHAVVVDTAGNVETIAARPDPTNEQPT